MGIQTSSINSGPVSGFKNKVINGDQRISQRGVGPYTSTSAPYMTDRFSLEPRMGTSCTYEQSTDTPSNEPFDYSLRISATNATDDGFHIRTSVELPGTGNYSTWVSGSQWTVSLWIKSAYSGRTLQPALFLSSNQNSGVAGTSQTVYPTGGGQTIPTTWTKLTFNYTLPTWVADTGSLTAVNCLVIRLLIGVNNTPQDIYFTGLQLEEGPVATEFEQRPFSTELALCQRYYEKSYNLAQVPGTVDNTNAVAPLWGGSASVVFGNAGGTFKVTKRTAAPSVTIYNPDTGAAGSIGNTGNVGSVTVGDSNYKFVISAATPQYPRWHFTAEAEL